MSNPGAPLGALLAAVVDQFLREGAHVELDGLGVFRRGKSKSIEFIADTAPRVFIAYVAEDTQRALRLADSLAAAGIRPWIDRRKLLPGQDWRGCIERAIDCADFFVPCFSRRATRKRGQFPYELRYALRCADRMPLDDLFIVPVRLEECEVPTRIRSQIQYVDLFPDWESGVRKVVASLEQEFERRRACS
jgi:hypothetical protein